jgi:hypothetical protein
MNFFKHISISVGESFVYYVDRYKFLYAMRKANRLHRLDGKRYWVIKLSGWYRVYSSADIKALKEQKVFKRDIGFVELQGIAAYNTNEINRRK